MTEEQLKAIEDQLRSSAPPHEAKGGSRCAVQESVNIPDWHVGVSPRNGYWAAVEGPWEDWRTLAENILGIKAADVPALVAEVRRLRAEAEHWRAFVSKTAYGIHQKECNSCGGTPGDHEDGCELIALLGKDPSPFVEVDRG